MSTLLEFMKESVNDKGYVTLTKNKIMENLLYTKMEDLNKDLSELIKNKKIFFTKENMDYLKEDGTITEFNTIKYFTDFEKYVDYNSEKLKQNIEKSSKKMNKEITNLEKLKDLSDEAKYVYDLTNNALKDKGYIDSKEILNDSKMLWNDFKQAQDELVQNKIFYLLKLENEQDKKYVLIKEDKYFAQLYEKEKSNEQINLNKEKEGNEISNNWDKKENKDVEMER
ncbi:hypothetical protein CEP89_07395 [Streptobacillus moniliformis]|nr:hypothetical protein [Streptobacillus moniliformis]AVL43626.1 hypothetical protein CEP89_07395 [Streptobacillus moniliformis]SQA13484.1 Uncharacterised protein [Streptobacillus moniliformis]